MADTKISALSALGAPAVADLFVVVDDSATETKKITYQGVMDGITILAELLGSAVVSGDKVVVFDISAGDAKYMDLDEFFEAIAILTSNSAPASGDSIVTYDSSASAARRVSLSDLFDTIETDTRMGAGFFGLGTPTELTIASGAVTATRSYHQIDTESDAATDNLDTINGGSDGDILVLRSVDAGRVTTIRDGQDNIRLEGNFSMDSVTDTITLIKVSTDWYEISRANNF